MKENKEEEMSKEDSGVAGLMNNGTKIKSEMENELILSIQVKYMQMAFELAKEALQREEVPVGCVFVFQDRVIGKGSNTVNETRNATHHAEMIALQAICEQHGPEIVQECELYVTCEPCIMCASALLHLKIKKVYFGCFNERFGGCGSILKVHENRSLHGKGYEVVGGIMEGESVELMKQFYKIGNKNAPSPNINHQEKKQKRN
jgi:tRNA-specific adenosine deaminase 2